MALLLSVSAATLSAFEFQQQKDTLIFRTKRSEIKIRNARIISVKNLKSNVVFADTKLPCASKSAGIGNMKDRAKEMSKLHFPWGEPTMGQQRPAIKKTQLYRFPHIPHEKSKLTVKNSGKSVKAVWKGLSDSVNFFADDSIELNISEDKNGALEIRSIASTKDKGVFGIQIPIENLNGEGCFVLPSFGGLRYKASGKPALIGFQDTGLFYEAKFMAYELKNSSLGYWYEDPKFGPYFIMFGRGEKASSFAIEVNNIMPFEARNAISTPPLKIDTFDNADWVAAATPYRNWYRKTFAADLAKRDSIKWANNIYAISDGGVGNDTTLNAIKKFMKPENVLLHVWQARKLGFTTNIPDYTLRDAYPGEVARAHKHGFKVMCYVCSLCAVYKSPQWEKDNVGDFFLTRKNNISNYHGSKNVFDENLMGTLTAAKGKDQFGHLKKGAFLYGDPLSKGWRNYFVNIVKTLNSTSGTDANYQDTLGCTSENGNGIVEGLAGAQGNSALARDLAKAMPNTPMASEFGPEPIAFAIKWPLNYPQVWGNKKFRTYRMHNQVPLSVYLFGYRTWIPTINAGDDFHKHLLVACSDGSGGLGMFSAYPGMNIKSGYADHMVWRSKIYADNKLEPYFPSNRYPENINAMYKGADGGIFKYYDDGNLQIMFDPKGKPLYGRVDGLASVNVKGLTLPGWPCYDKDGIYGLNPKNYYALFPADSTPAEITFGKLPAGVMLRYYYATYNYAYAQFNGKGKIKLNINYPARFKEMYVNDVKVSGKTIEAELPVRIFLTDGKTFTAKRTLRVANSNGLQSGKSEALHQLKRHYAGQILHYLHGFNSVVMDSVFEVKNADDAVELYAKNEQQKYGNGTILTVLVNGVEKAKLDCCSSAATRDRNRKSAPVWDTKLRKWTIPLGEYKGKKVLFSVKVDNKASNNADMQFVSTPQMVKQAEQKFVETFPNGANPPKAQGKHVVVRPEGTPVSVKNYSLPGKGAQGIIFEKPVKGLNSVSIPGLFTIDPNSRYVLSAKVRNTADKKSTFYLGVIQYDKNTRQIYGSHINRLADSTSKLSHTAKAGAKKLMVFDASAWRVGGYVGIGPVPSRQQVGPIVNIEQYGGDWGVFLKNPLKKEIPAETEVGEHFPMSTHKYLYTGRLPNDFTEIGGEIKWWPGATKFQIIFFGNSATEVKDIKLEIYKK